jgi:hypothetical protein
MHDNTRSTAARTKAIQRGGWQDDLVAILGGLLVYKGQGEGPIGGLKRAVVPTAHGEGEHGCCGGARQALRDRRCANTPERLRDPEALMSRVIWVRQRRSRAFHWP